MNRKLKIKLAKSSGDNTLDRTPHLCTSLFVYDSFFRNTCSTSAYLLAASKAADPLSHLQMLIEFVLILNSF